MPNDTDIVSMVTVTTVMTTTAFSAILVAMMVGCLMHYYRRLGQATLRLGAFVLLMEFVSFLSIGSLSILDTLVLLPAGLLMKQLGSWLLASLLWRLMGRLLSPLFVLVPIVSALLIPLMLSLSVSLTLIAIFLVVPVSCVLLVSTFMLWHQVKSLPCLSMCALTGLHIVLSGLQAVFVESADLFPVFLLLDVMVILMACGTLMVFAAEWSLTNLSERDRSVERFAQQTRRLEMQYSQAQKHESLGVLAGGIAHDFNNMLTSILGYTSLAMRELPKDSPIRKDLYMVMSGARQAVDLTSQMLAYTGKGAIEFQPVDLSRVVDSLASLTNSIVPENIHLVQQLSPQLPMVRGDTVQLGQVVMNLVANAVDAHEGKPGSITIKTQLVDVDSALMMSAFFADSLEPGAYLCLEVSDSGVGIGTSQLEKIFDPFYSDKSDKSQSRGLGLSSLAGMVRQHGGFVRVSSAQGAGSTFSVYLPVVTYRDASDIDITPQRDVVAGRRGRVLLAEDDQRIRSLMVSILQSELFVVEEAEDGRQAMDRITASGSVYDLIVLDCTMPKLSGMDAYQQIRASGIHSPVILMSGYRQEQVLKDISRDEKALFMEKPFTVDQLIDTVSVALDEGGFYKGLSKTSSQPANVKAREPEEESGEGLGREPGREPGREL